MSQFQACPECGQPIGGSAEVCALCGHTLATATAPQVWRIPCPNGHVSKVAEGLIGRQLACPECNEQFVARIADSLEQRKKDRQRQAKREAELAAKWLARAVWAGVIFGLLLVTLFVLSVIRR
jgi:hypothetical protein